MHALLIQMVRVIFLFLFPPPHPPRKEHACLYLSGRRANFQNLRVIFFIRYSLWIILIHLALSTCKFIIWEGMIAFVEFSMIVQLHVKP